MTRFIGCIWLFFSIWAAGWATPASAVITVIDGAGRTVELERAARRIVVVGRGVFIPLHMLAMFPETAHRLVGYEKRGSSTTAFLQLIDPAYARAATMAANPGTEQIAALHPDLVITKGRSPGTLEKAMAVLDIPVVNLGVENPERFMTDIENLGKVLGNPERAAQIIAYYRSRLHVIDAGVGGLASRDRPGVLVLSYSERGGERAVQVPGNTWTQTLQVRRAGGRPVWLDRFKGRHGWQVVGFEQIAAWDPDTLFVIVWYRLDGCSAVNALAGDSAWQRLRAVANGRLHLFPADIYGWDTPDPRWILGMLWMATKIHPQRFAHVRMKQEVYAFFNQLYGLEKETVDTRMLPGLHIDGCR